MLDHMKRAFYHVVKQGRVLTDFLSADVPDWNDCLNLSCFSDKFPAKVIPEHYKQYR